MQNEVINSSGKRGFFRRNSCGQALVESVLVLPIIILMVIFMFDLGRAICVKHVLDRAVREGARTGAMQISGDKAVKTAISTCKYSLTSINLGAGAVINASIIDVDGMEGVRVTATLPFNSIIPTFIFPGNALSASTVMRKEG
ncbi:MAG TPA: TadE/TadG family type IV pilus assembly protein [Candidatus Omnitrophota bacterium]|nr:TadE/TadG family type IV pilus assembly protein [Candidatus Omnitrophota bacterium]